MEAQELKDLKNITKTVNVVDAFYRKLYTLEIEGNKDSDEYNNTLEALRVTLRGLQGQFRAANLDYQRCISWINYLTITVPKNYSSDIESVVIQDYDDRVVRRISKTLGDMVNNDPKAYRVRFPQEVVELADLFNLSSEDSIVISTLNDMASLNFSVERDIYAIYLGILNEYINDDAHKVFRDRLIASKYYCSFVNENNEKEMLENKFDISGPLYLKSRAVADIIKCDGASYQELNNDVSFMIGIDQIVGILEITDLDYGDPVKATSSILRQALLRTTLILMDDSNIEEAQTLFTNTIKSREYNISHPTNKISREIIKECFANICKDKEKPAVLSIGARQD